MAKAKNDMEFSEAKKVITVNDIDPNILKDAQKKHRKKEKYHE